MGIFNFCLILLRMLYIYIYTYIYIYICPSHQFVLVIYMLSFQNVITAILENANACMQLSQKLQHFTYQFYIIHPYYLLWIIYEVNIPYGDEIRCRDMVCFRKGICVIFMWTQCVQNMEGSLNPMHTKRNETVRYILDICVKLSLKIKISLEIQLIIVRLLYILKRETTSDDKWHSMRKQKK